MPEKETIESARQDKAEGKAPTTQAGEFVREEMEHVREGKHSARPELSATLMLGEAGRRLTPRSWPASGPNEETLGR